MYLDSTVKEVKKDGTISVGCSSEACQGCKVSMFCNNRKDSSFFAVNPRNYNLKKGDKVELFLPPGRTVLSTMLVFALPLAMFPAGYCTAKHWFCFNEVVNALFGFAFMAVAFSIAALINIKNRKKLMPEVVGVVENPE